MSDPGCARYVVEHSDAPEEANQGIWYFCAHAASSAEYLVRRALADGACFRRLVRNHLDRLRTDARIAEDFLTDWGDDT